MAAVIGLVSLSASLNAASYTYTAPNSTTTNTWSTGTAWTGAVAPVSATDTTLVFGGSFSSGITATTKNDLTPGTPFLLNVMTLSASNSAVYTNATYSIAPNAGTNTLNFTADGATTAVVNLNSSKGPYSNNVNFTVSLNATIDGGLLTFQGSGSNSFNFSGILSDGGSAANVTKTGSSALTLSGANTFTGGVTLSAGTLNINNASALGATAGTFTMANGVKIDNTSAGAITNSQNNAQVWNGDFTWSGTKALNLGTGAVTLGANSIITVGGTGALTVGGAISDGVNSYSLTMGTPGSKNTGTLILANTSNSYDGGTFINSGFLQIAAAGSLGGSGANVTVNSGGALNAAYALDQATLGRLTTGSTGVIGLAANSSNNLDFSAATGANLAVTLGGTGTYSGTLTPQGTTYRLGGAGGTLVMSNALADISGSPTNLVVGAGGSAGTVTLGAAGTYSGGTTVMGVPGSTASVLQTNVLTGVSSTPFGPSNSAITLNNGTLGFGSAATLASGNVMNVTGYDVTFDTGTIKLQVGSGSSVTYTANSLNQSSLGGVLYIAPTSAASLGTTEKVFVTNTSATIPLTVTNGMIAPSIIDSTNKTFLTYDAVKGFSDATTTSVFGAGNVVSITTDPNSAQSAYALRTTALMQASDNFTLGAGGFLSTVAQNNGRGTINFGSTPGYYGIYGGGAILTAMNATAGVTFYGTGAGFSMVGLNITGGLTFASGSWTFTPQPTGSEVFQTANPNPLVLLSGATITEQQGSKMTFASIEGAGTITESASNAFTLTINGLNRTGTSTFTGAIVGASGGAGNIIKTGTNTQVFSGLNSYNGTTTVSGGTLKGTQTSGTPFGVGSVTLGTGMLSLAPGGSGADVVLTGANKASTDKFTFNAGAQVNLDKGGNTSLTYMVGNTGATANSVLVRGTNGTLIVAPASGTAALGTATGEKFIVNGGVTTTNGITSAAIIGQDSNANKDGTFLAYDATNGLKAATYSDTDFAFPSFTNVEDVTAAGYANLPTTKVFALRNAGVLSIGSGNTLTIGDGSSSPGGVILNGGSITGGTLAFAASPGVIYSNLVGGSISSVITGSAGVSIVGPGVTTFAGANTYTSSTQVNNSTLSISSNGNLGTTTNGLTLNGGTLQSTATLNLGTRAVTLAIGPSNYGGVFDVADGTTLTAGGVLSGSGGLIKANTGTLTLSGTNTYTGATNISGGKLLVNGSLAAGSAVSIGASGTLGGSGTVGGTVAVAGAISPGNSPGTLTTGAETWITGGAYVWEINNATGVQGTNWDFISSTGTLDITGLSSSGQFNVNVIGLTAGDVSGSVLNWTDADASWKIASFTSVVGTFASNLFNVDTSGFTNNNTATGTFTITNIGGDLYLNYVTAIPEPSTYAAIFGALALAGVVWRRRSRA
ncbi:MAG: autotransporter-associated beta strand repeat-containing protein [Opitutaceae bacterium]